MSQDTKIRFSEVQLKAMQDTAFFDVKREVTQHVSLLFQQLQDALQEVWNTSPLKALIESPPPKIFRGENYRGYPYVNLDYPRHFHSDNVFAYRTLFWWGHGFSFTLHVQGHSFREFHTDIAAHLHSLAGKEVFISAGSSPWEYHYGSDNYRSLDEVLNNNLQEVIPEQAGFVKISKRLPLPDYENLVDKGAGTFREFTAFRNR